MTLPKLAPAALALSLLASPALAGAPDTPGEKGDMIAQQKAIQEGEGAPNWGSVVSDRAKNGSTSGALSLGDFLRMFSGGPNPFNDNGRGNDNR